jgi:hypothetical protein
MAIPPNDMTLWNLLDSKPEDTDRVNPVYDIDADEQKCQLYSVFKTFFVKTDEPTDVEAIVEFQSTATKPNSILKFGAAGEFHVYSDGTDLFVKGTNAAGKLRFYANSVEMLTLDPVADSIATYGNALNYDGTAGKGLIFAVTTNNARFTEQLNCKSLFVAENGIKMLSNNISYSVAENGIKMLSNNISYSGAIDTGLEYDVSNNAYFKQNLNCADILNVEGQINANKTGEWSLVSIGKVWFKNNIKVVGNRISYDGGNNGIGVNSSHNAVVDNALIVGTTISSTGNITSDNTVEGGWLKGGFLDITDGRATPSTIAGRARIWVDTGGNVKIKHGDGTIETFTTT